MRPPQANELTAPGELHSPSGHADGRIVVLFPPQSQVVILIDSIKDKLGVLLEVFDQDVDAVLRVESVGCRELGSEYATHGSSHKDGATLNLDIHD